jgi:hypothetical protein
MTLDQLAAAVALLIRRVPGCTLAKNQVGNLSVLLDGEYVGFVDLRTGDVELFDDED